MEWLPKGPYFPPFGTFNLGVLPSLGMDSWLLGSEEVDGRGENFEGAKWLENKLKEREPIGVSVLWMKVTFEDFPPCSLYALDDMMV